MNALLVLGIAGIVTVAAIGLVLVWLAWGRDVFETRNEIMKKIIGKGK